jgi:hypothetical protein
MIRGSCCCGAVAFELSSPPTMMGTCHCARCRKVGASTLVFVKRDTFRWIAGESEVTRYAPEPPYRYERCFCKRCGSALGEIFSAEETFPIAANVLDDDPGLSNSFHEFVSEKPAWHAIGDAAKQFEGHPK